MSKLINQFVSRDFYKFMLVGGFAAAVNFAARILLSKVFPFAVAVCIAYIIGMVVAFVLNRILVFQPSVHDTYRQFFYFTLVNLFAVAQTVAVSVFFVEYAFPMLQFRFFPEEVGHLIGISVPIFTSFLGHKYITFSPRTER